MNKNILPALAILSLGNGTFLVGPEKEQPSPLRDDQLQMIEEFRQRRINNKLKSARKL